MPAPRAKVHSASQTGSDRHRPLQPPGDGRARAPGTALPGSLAMAKLHEMGLPSTTWSSCRRRTIYAELRSRVSHAPRPALLALMNGLGPFCRVASTPDGLDCEVAAGAARVAASLTLGDTPVLGWSRFAAGAVIGTCLGRVAGPLESLTLATALPALAKMPCHRDCERSRQDGGIHSHAAETTRCSHFPHSGLIAHSPGRKRCY
jgi:hypothetical protein